MVDYNLDKRPAGLIRVTAGTNGYYGRNDITVIPASGAFTNINAEKPFVFPEGLSSASGTPVRIPQQTFLGASIRNFSMNGGFGDSSSTLSVDLVVDEYNKSDNTAQGYGDDVYHSGNGDGFVPPMVGSPVFFKFGPTRAKVEQAYRRTFDILYNVDSMSSQGSPFIGSGHVVFGGILQSYVQNRGPAGNPLYSVQVTDPREILSNVTLILNNYAGSSYNTKNVFNIYGFLEHNMTPTLSGTLQNTIGTPNFLVKGLKTIDGEVFYSGSVGPQYPLDCFVNTTPLYGFVYKSFPITGTGFSRRSPQGIPYYRVAQAVNSLVSYNYALPNEYKNRGFGGTINFRGYNYVVDFSGLPTLPPLYFLDFDQINLLDLALEICDVASRDLFVSLLPVITHPACAYLKTYNDGQQTPASGMIHGIIRLDAIDRSAAPSYGAIKQYIDNLSGIYGIYVENQDIGFELSNIVTDKFVVGAQEVETHFFSSNSDRDVADARDRNSANNGKQWLLGDQLSQQILPYYGLLGNKAVTIPKGWGSYQQILLDTTGLNAKGVGAYYVATEMELRCASVSYDCWKNFLKQYNDIYLESFEQNDAFQGAALQQTANFANVPPSPISNNYGVTVPRSVFPTYALTPFGSDNLPASPCNPPYGYPLYYKRMTKIGIPEGGLTKIAGRMTSCIEGAAALMSADASSYKQLVNNQLQELGYIQEEYGTLTAAEQAYYNAVSGALASPTPNIQLLTELSFSLHQTFSVLPRLAKKGTENALKIYSFLKKVADENLGKKFLVKIPNKVNFNYTQAVQGDINTYTSGPFGFRPRPTNDLSPVAPSVFLAACQGQTHSGTASEARLMKKFLASGVGNPNYVGALKSNYNPISNQYEFNYLPSNLGGFFNFDLCSNIYKATNIPANQSGITRALIPIDLTNFLNDEGRISPYVRFDNSQYLSFKDFNSEDFTQQVVQASHFIPDMCELLDNTGDGEWHDFTNSNANRPDNVPLQKTVAFVKCSVDEKLYMTPKIISSGLLVYGNCGAGDYRLKTSRPRKIFIPCSGLSGTTLVPGTGVYVDSFRYTEYDFYPTSGAAGNATRETWKQKTIPLLNSHIVDIDELDTNHVYAVITLPNKVTATKDARYRDALNQKENTYDIKHYLTVDVVKNLPEFANPPYAFKPRANNIRSESCNAFTSEVASVAWLAAREIQSKMQFGLHNQMQLVAPSPVYPDLVALPLISSERSYGPWLSSQLDGQSACYSNVGGKVEFVKDENLSPWHYGGYDLMNQAGIGQARFSNSLLLFSERGGFTFPDIPRNSLCTALSAGGPLVTSITVDVSDTALRTTYKLDTYTASFGKLHKQKQDMISKVSRERQKLRDERNALVRKGFGKFQSNNNPNVLTSQDAQSVDQVKNHIVASVAPKASLSYVPAAGGRVDDTDHYYAASVQSESDIINTYNSFDSDIDRNNAQYNAGSTSMSDMYMPYSNEPHHPNMPNVQYSDFAATYRLYESDEFKVNDDDITYPA